MKKAVIFGLGTRYEKIKDALFEGYDIVALADNKKIGTVADGIKVSSPDSIKDIDYDLIIVTEYYFGKIVQQLRKLGVPDKDINLNHIADDLQCTLMEGDSSLFEYDKIKAIMENRIDQYIFTETNIWENYGYLFDRKSIVIDIGMNKGFAALYFAKNDWVEKVYGYEPVTYTYGKALQNFKLNDKSISKKISPFNYGLGENTEDRFLKGFTTEGTGYSSTIHLHKDLSLFDNVEYNIPVKIKNAALEIKSILNEHKGCEIVCKIDTEGSEFEIIELLEKEDLLKAIYVYMVEVHSYMMPVPKQAINNMKGIFLKNNYAVIISSTGLNAQNHMLYAIRREV